MWNREKKYQVIELLKELREARLWEVTSGYTDDEVANLSNDDIYDLDDGEQMIQSIDTLLAALGE